MNRLAPALIALAAILTASAAPIGPELARCRPAGSGRCGACSDCTLCRHCNAEKGACTVCAHHESPE